MDASLFKRSLAREKKARRSAELFLEEKSRELHAVNEQLRETAAMFNEEAARFASIFDAIPEGIISFDSDGTIDTVNPTFEKIFGYSREELIDSDVGKLISFLSFYGNEKTEGIENNFENIKSAVIERSFLNLIGKTKAGKEIRLEVTGSQIESERGELNTWVFRDVSERLELERQLALAQKMQSVGQLAAGIAHEINTPMQFILHNSSFLKDAFSDLEPLFAEYETLTQAVKANKDASEICARIDSLCEEIDLEYLLEEIPESIEHSNEGSTQVAEIVKAMKEFSHPGQAQMSLNCINECLASTITVSRNEWKYIGEIETDFDTRLPKIICMPTELNQVFLNLIVNSAHAINDRIQRKEITLGEIKVSTQLDGDFAQIQIQDNGGGIPEDVKEKVFEPFFTTKDVGKGTGQGLAIAYSVIKDKHNGEITLDTIEGESTTFTVRLPIAQNKENCEL